MLSVKRTNSDDADFKKLVLLLDADLRIRDGVEHVFYAQLNKMASVINTVVAYDNEIAVGCGAKRPFDQKIMEVKRMFVSPEYRGKGIAAHILSELELWCAETGIEKCILETGKKQPEAIRLYEKNGYKSIPTYGDYKEVGNSICFEKTIK